MSSVSWFTKQGQPATRRSWPTGLLALLLAGFGVWLIVQAFTVPVIAEPPMLPEDDPPTPQVTAPVSPTPTPSVLPSSLPTPSAEPSQTVMPRPRGNPKRVTMTSVTDGVLVDSELVAIHVRPDDRLVPPTGKAGWLADKGWPKPGVSSDYNSIVAGHVSAGHNKPDVFYDLSKLRKGDEVVVKYDTGDRVVIVITKNPKSIGKDDVPEDPKYDWVWENWEGLRIVSFFTCDPSSGYVDNHSVNNWVTQGEVVEVVRASTK